MNNKAIKGTTLQCIQHFRANVLESIGAKRKDQKYAVRNTICDLLKVGHSAGHDWFDHSRLPYGVNLIKLRYFLECVGYKVSENQNLTPIVRFMFTQVALSVLKLEEITGATGVNPNTVLRWLTGKSEPLEEKEHEIIALTSTRTGAADNASRAWFKVIEEELHLVSRSDVKVSAQPVSVDPVVPVGPSNGIMVTTLSHLLLAALPLAEQVLAHGSPAERDRLRSETRIPSSHSNAVFELSNVLNRLCSERARNEIKPQTRKD